MMRAPSLCTVVLLAAACGSPSRDDASRRPEVLGLPRPTEHRLDEEAEERNARDRKAWMAHMHQAADGVDWKSIERRNGDAEMWRRRRIAHQQATGLLSQPWKEVGSRNQAGRMHCAVIGPPGPSGQPRLYAGSSLGGVWRGELDGTGWVPLGDNLFGGAHELLVVPGANPGDEDVVLAATDGGAVHVTSDGGLTWQAPAGLPTLSEVRGVAVLADGVPTMLVLGVNAGRIKLYGSVNRGQTFAERWASPISNSRGAMWVPRRGPAAANTVYVVDKGRVRVSTDGGFNFTLLDAINTTSERGRIAGSEAGAPTLYASLYVGGTWKLYRSDDAGASFAFLRNLTDYWESLQASSVSANIVAYAGVEAWRSADSGASFTKVNGWGEYYSDPVHKLHADIPGLYCFPDPALPQIAETWYVCTDGGLYESTTQLSTVLNLSLNGLGVSQYYSTLSSSSDPDLILAGSQDQGYQRGRYQPSVQPGPSSDFDQLISGDYGHLTSSDGTHGLVYCTYPGFILIQAGQSSPTLYTDSFPSGVTNAWLPPVVADPLDVAHFFFLADTLWRYERVTTSNWNAFQHSTQDFAGGSANYMSAMAFAPSDAQRVYAANDAGGLFASTDHGVTWTQAAATGPPAHYFYGTALVVNPSDPLEAFVGGSGYSTAGVWRTTDGGTTWAPAATGLPQTLVYGLAYAGDGSGDVYAATEAGAWRRAATSGTWTNIMGNAAPITLYWSVESVNAGEVIRFGTYGRGIWDFYPNPSTDGCWIPYGEGLGGAHILELDSITPPNIGSDVVFDVRNGNGPATGWVLSSLNPGSQPLFGGTLLLASMDGVARIYIGPTGEGSRSLSIPDDFLLISTSMYFQAVVQDPSQPAGYALSNGLQAVIGF